jgi:hypothetical protein
MTFQVLWFLAVLGREDWQWLLLMTVAVLWFLLFRQRAQGVLPLLVLSLFGILVDSLNLYWGVLEFGQPRLPLWMLGLWLLFSWYLAFLGPVMNRFSPHLVLIAYMVGGSLSYFAAIRLFAATTSYSLPITLTVLACEWLVIGVIAIRAIHYVETFAIRRADSLRDTS